MYLYDCEECTFPITYVLIQSARMNMTECTQEVLAAVEPEGARSRASIADASLARVFHLALYLHAIRPWYTRPIHLSTSLAATLDDAK